MCSEFSEKSARIYLNSGQRLDGVIMDMDVDLGVERVRIPGMIVESVNPVFGVPEFIFGFLAATFFYGIIGAIAWLL